MSGVEDVNKKVNKTIRKKKSTSYKKNLKIKETIDLCEMIDKTNLNVNLKNSNFGSMPPIGEKDKIDLIDQKEMLERLIKHKNN